MAITVRDTEDVFARDDYTLFIENEIKTTRICIEEGLLAGADLYQHVAV